jgi:glutathione S-transferase
MSLSKFKLYCSLTSPYSRKVRVAFEELGLGDRVETILIDPFSSAAPPEFLVANPLSRIPVLVTDKGETLPDSSLILEYLQHRFRGLALVPRGALRWSVLRRTQLGEGILNAAVGIVLEKRRPESIVFTSYIDRQAEVIRRAVHQLHVAADLLGKDRPGVQEITVGVALSYLDFRLPWIEWRREHDALAAWHTEFAQRPSMQATAPPSN